MNRKQIKDAGVGAELFYQDGSHWGDTYRAVVESVEPKTTRRGAPNRGVEVTLWDEDDRNLQYHWGSWRKDADTGKWYRRAVVDSTKLKGDWKGWRKEQLAMRARDKAERERKDAARDLALDIRGKINTAIGEELRERFGAAQVSSYGGTTQIEMPAALALELLAGWDWAVSEHADPMDGVVKVTLPWRKDSEVTS